MSAGRKIWSIIYPVLLYFLISIAVTAVIEFAAIAVFNFGIYDIEAIQERAPSLMLIITLVTYIVTFAVFFFLYRKERRMTGRSDLPLSAKGVILTIAVCLAVSLALQVLLAVSGIEKLFPSYQNVVDTTFSGQPFLLLALTVGVIGPVSEEIIFRGLVFERLERYLGTKPAIYISALIFGAVHLNMVQFIYATVIGILFALFYSKYRNIRIPVIAHITVNMAGVVLMAIGY